MPPENSKNWRSPLTEAVIEGNLPLVRSLLAAGDDINEFSYFYGHKEAPLLTAVRYVRLDIVRELLNHGAIVNLASSKGNTPLIHAAQRNSLTLMSDLIKHGADVHATDAAGHSAMYWMVMERNKDGIELLLRNEAGVNLKGDQTPRQPLLHLVIDSTEFLSYLLDKGAKVNALDNMQETPLFSAVRSDNLASVKLLLSRGAKVNAMNDDYRTPLHLAAASVNNSLEIAELLLENGAKVNAFDRYLNTPLVLSLRNYILQPNKKVARCLIQHGSLVKYKMCTEALEWTIGADLELLQYAVTAGLRLARVPWVRELLNESISKRQWHIMGQDSEQKDRIVNYIQTELQTVPSLSVASRIVIREHLIQVSHGCSILSRIQQLPVPVILKKYLTLPES